jgi:CelD/BcsL family acetyltransferase involved in cellulose biosynthesis
VLPATYEEYVASLNRRVRKKIRQTRRNMLEHPTAKIELASTGPEALRTLDDLIELHQSRWTGKGYPGAFADPRVVRFHRAIVSTSLEQGRLRMYALRDGDEAVAVSYSFRTRGFAQAYLSSFSEKWSDWSPGVLVHANLIERSIAEGATRFDFLEGDEGYKAAWCPQVRENLRLLVFNRTIGGHLARTRHRARQTAVTLARRWVAPELRERGLKVLTRFGSSSRASDDDGS